MENSQIKSIRYFVPFSKATSKTQKVKVFYICDNKNIVKTIKIKKNGVHKDDAYYIKEAEKIIKKSLPTGELNTFASKFLKLQVARKVLVSTTVIVGVGGVSGGAYGGYLLYEDLQPRFTVTWKNYDGEILEVDENVRIGSLPHYDQATPTKKADDYFTYTFTNWSGDINKPIVEDTTFVAQFSSTSIEYNITLDLNGGKFIEKPPVL